MFDLCLRHYIRLVAKQLGGFLYLFFEFFKQILDIILKGGRERTRALVPIFRVGLGPGLENDFRAHLAHQLVFINIALEQEQAILLYVQIF